ncbi:MAG TPA: M20 family metallopeptidase [Vicinamibacterales bacterium]
MTRELQTFCREQHDWLIDTIESLVRIESPTTDKRAVDRCGAELQRRLELIGGRVTKLPRVDRGDHLLAEFGCGASQVLLLGHFDTVWPVGQLEKMPLSTSDGRLHGPGVFDMKAGIGIAMLAARALLETNMASPHRVVMLWTTDEEIGSATSRAAIEDEARRSAAVLVLEPSLPGGAVKTSRKGCGQYELLVRGVAAHAGIDPKAGASAIHELAHQIEQLIEIPKDSDGVSLNVGIVGGGTRPNVVADEARAVVDVRAATGAQMDAVDRAIRNRTPRDSRTRIEMTGGFDRPPLERTPAVVRLYEQARSVGRELGLDLGEGGTGGGSDGNFTAAIGVPTLDGLGAVGEGAHALHEHVVVERLTDRAALVAGLIRSI